MVNKIDKEEFRFIEVAFILKTNLRHVSAIDINGKDSFKHLQDIIESTKPMIKTLCLVHDDVERTYRNVTNVMTNSKKILEYHFIWARMILEFYYFYHDSKEEALKIVNHMLSFEGYEYVKEAVRAGIKLIDNYYESEWKETIPDTPRTQKSQCVVAQEIVPQQTASESCPDILQLMQDINSGKIRYTNVNWEVQLKQLLFLCRLMPKKFPDVILVWGIIGILDDPTTKMDIIGKLQDAAPKCFDSPFDAQAFIDDCSCVYRVCLEARAYNLRNDIKSRHVWTDDRKDLNDLAHIFSDAVVNPQWMVGMVEEMKRSESENRKHPLLEIVLKSNRNIGQLSINNIVDFAKRLYIAEGFRQLILSGQEDYRDIPTLEKFNWRLRNACFDVYIDLRKEQIKELLNQDNTRVDGADDLEALQNMYKEETSVVAREKELDCIKGSPAYNAMWYPGRQMVQDMINVFIQYLKKRIEKAKKDAAEKEALEAISSNAAMTKMAAIVKQAMAGQVERTVEGAVHIPAPEQPTDESTNSEEVKRPKVFISYSWDGKEHEEWVLKLAEDLRCKNGIDIILDKWEMKLGKPLTHFMAHAVTDSDRVICVMTPNYKKKTDNLEGGVGVEYSIISAEIQKNIKTEKFIPLFRSGDDVPTFLAGRDYIDMRDDNKYNETIEDLVRDIFDKPKYKKPELGPMPNLN